MKHNRLEELQERLQLRFHQPQLLQEAFTHSSFVNEQRQKTKVHNERLEFLGDAVLQITVSDFLFHQFPKYPEGKLTKMRAAIVCEPSLAKFAAQLQLGDYIVLGRGEEHLGGRTRPALLADLFESLLGAVYLDQGLEAARTFLQTYIFPNLQFDEYVVSKDYKSTLQEHVQQVVLGPIQYQITEERGPAHNREFVATVSISGVVHGTGIGKSKKDAEQRAAAEALNTLNLLK